MNSQEQALRNFAEFAAKLNGDRRSEAQTFQFHLPEAFNHETNTFLGLSNGYPNPKELVVEVYIRPER
jgi:hypothetical protein